MDEFEISKGILQKDVRRNVRMVIQIQYEIGFEDFLKANYLADEVFYINYIDKHQKQYLEYLGKKVNFHDISDGGLVTKKIQNKWYNEKKTRDHFWYITEFQLFLNERLQEIKDFNTIQPDTAPTEKYLGQPTNKKANEFFDFLIEYYRPEDKTQIKYVNILHYLKNDAHKKHFIFKVKQSEYKILVEKKTGIKISKFDKSVKYPEEEKPIFHSLENTFLKNKTV